MSSIPFINAPALLIFECKIEPRSTGQVWLALDTGATTTILSNEALNYIGFQPEEMQDLATFGDASQPHIVPKIILPAFSLGDVTIKGLEALSYSLPEDHGIDGAIGLNFLRHFKRIIIDFEQAQLILEN